MAPLSVEHYVDTENRAIFFFFLLLKNIVSHMNSQPQRNAKSAAASAIGTE